MNHLLTITVHAIAAHVLPKAHSVLQLIMATSQCVQELDLQLQIPLFLGRLQVPQGCQH